MTTPDLPPLPNDGIAACVVLLHRMLEAPTSQISVGWKNAIGPALLALRPDTPLQPFVDYDADQMRAYGDARAAAAVLAERADTEYLRWRINELIPLFDEARDALTAISVAAAKLHRVDLSLGDRMDRAGTRTRAEFDAIRAEPKEQQNG
jgi:hypothetical protein